LKHILFLQRPTNKLFAHMANRLSDFGHQCFSINLSAGDAIFGVSDNAVNFDARLDEWPAFIRQYIAEHGITDIVLLGEQRAYHRVAIQIATEKGINIFVTDFGYIRPDWVIFERDGMNAESLFPRDAASIFRLAEGLPAVDKTLQYRDSFFKQATWDMAFHLSQVYWPFRFPHYQRHTLSHPILNYCGIGLRLLCSPIARRRAAHVLAKFGVVRDAVVSQAQKKFFVFAMQTEDDFSIRAYSHYPDLIAPIDETIRSFAKYANSDAALIFKIHPLDPGLKRWRSHIRKMAHLAGVGGRVHFIDGGDLDQMLRQSAGLVTVNSTVGIRAIELGCPVIALGQAVYRVDGLTFEAGDSTHLRLDRFWQEASPPDVKLADAFMRAIAATLHVRGSYYNHAGIEAAAEAMAYRLHHDLVNVSLAAVNRGERLTLRNRD
jgi:capsular polysaccharide export protein